MQIYVACKKQKGKSFDALYVRNFCTPEFDNFMFLPSNGASDGILVAWKSSVFSGELLFQNEYAISISFTSRHNEDSWVLTTIYAPCHSEGKREFLNWFQRVQMPEDIDWLIVGDFNLIRRPEYRNREGGDLVEMFLFNEAISNLGLVELPFLGRQFTWTNKQNPPLLERLDWFFTSAGWTVKFPNSVVKSLIMETSDHWPCVIEINSKIPKGNLFKFENHWLNHDSFIPLVQQVWALQSQRQDPARRLTEKFKTLRRVIRQWQSSLSSLSMVIQKVKSLIHLIESLELLKDLSPPEWNFRNLLCDKLISLLKMQRAY